MQKARVWFHAGKFFTIEIEDFDVVTSSTTREKLAIGKSEQEERLTQQIQEDVHECLLSVRYRS